MKCIVTGGAGFIGANLVAALVKRGDDVVVVDDYSGGNYPNRKVEGANYQVLDIAETGTWEFFRGSELVFHLAALPRVQYSIEHPIETARVNVHGTMRVLQASKEYGVRRFVFAASSAAYGDQEVMPIKEAVSMLPKSPYALHKCFGEQLCDLWSKVYELQTVSLRLFNTYGPLLDLNGDYALVIGKFLKQKREGVPLTITGDGEQTRDFIHVSDVVNAMLLASESKRVGSGEVINIGSGREVSINSLARIYNAPVKHIAPRLEHRRAQADISRARTLLNWEPSVAIEDGIGELIGQNL